MKLPNPHPGPTLDVRADLTANPWEGVGPDNTSGGYLTAVALDRDVDGRALVALLVQVAPDHYVVAWTTLALARMALTTLGASPIVRESS